MTAKYLIRLDDAHPCMNHEKWVRVESICLKYNVKPIIAVIPDNKDESLNYSSANENFATLKLPSPLDNNSRPFLVKIASTVILVLSKNPIFYLL